MSKKRLLFLGDTHGRFKDMIRLINIERPDAIVVAGDFGYWPYKNSMLHNMQGKFDCPVFFVDGNHEQHDMLQHLVDKRGNANPIAVGNNTWYIPRGCIFELFGYKILGMGGGYSIDRMLRTKGVNWFDREELTLQDIETLQPDHVDIVVSHTCPQCILPRVTKKVGIKHRIQNDQSERMLDYVFNMYNPSMWFFGHWHGYGGFRENNTKLYLLDMIYRDEIPSERRQYRIIKER